MNENELAETHECSFTYYVFDGIVNKTLNGIITRHVQQLRRLVENGTLVKGNVHLDPLHISSDPDSLQFRFPVQSDEDVDVIFALIDWFLNSAQSPKSVEPIELMVTCRYTGTFRDSPIYPMHEAFSQLNKEMFDDTVYTGYDRNCATGRANVIIGNYNHVLDM